MGLKVGQRVMVLSGVSNCKDAESLRVSARTGKPGEGADRSHFVGLRGEIVQIGKDGPCTCPNEKMVLVDDHIVNGKPQGAFNMREWFLPEELELG